MINTCQHAGLGRLGLTATMGSGPALRAILVDQPILIGQLKLFDLRAWFMARRLRRAVHRDQVRQARLACGLIRPGRTSTCRSTSQVAAAYGRGNGGDRPKRLPCVRRVAGMVVRLAAAIEARYPTGSSRPACCIRGTAGNGAALLRRARDAGGHGGFAGQGALGVRIQVMTGIFCLRSARPIECEAVHRAAAGQVLSDTVAAAIFASTTV